MPHDRPFSNPDGDPLTVAIVQAAQHDSVWVNADGPSGYTPAAGFTGGDMVGSVVNDGILSSSTAYLTLNVLPSPPATAGNLWFSVVHDTLLQGANVLASATIRGGDAPTVTIETMPQTGTAGVNAGATIQFDGLRLQAGQPITAIRNVDGRTQKLTFLTVDP